MRMYRDIETGEVLSIEDLKKEWTEKGGISGSGDPCTFAEYVRLCSVSENGTLELVTA